MKIISLYKFTRENGGVTVTPRLPDVEHQAAGVRLIADTGKVLTRDGVSTYKVIDTDSAEGWQEIEDTKAYDEVLEEGVGEE